MTDGIVDKCPLTLIFAQDMHKAHDLAVKEYSQTHTSVETSVQAFTQAAVETTSRTEISSKQCESETDILNVNS